MHVDNIRFPYIKRIQQQIFILVFIVEFIMVFIFDDFLIK
jgi:hypothetical protein